MAKGQRNQPVAASMVTVFGCLLIAASWAVPTLGEISPSALTAYGEALTFAGALYGIKYSSSKKRNENETEES